MRTLLAGILLTVSAWGQVLIERDRVGAAQEVFAAATGRQQRCEFHAVRPAIDYAFRFRTGYMISMPVGLIQGQGPVLTILVRVTPKGRDAVYLSESGNLPGIPEARGEAEIPGTFVVGEGSYDVEALVQNDGLQLCRGSWQIEAHYAGSERELRTTIPAGTVDAVSAAPPGRDTRPATIGRLTVLLHAAPLSPNLSALQPADLQRLTDSLRSALLELPARSVRLIAFNLDQRAVVFRKDGFALTQMSELITALNQMRLGMVDYKTLRENPTPVDLLVHLSRAELEGDQPPDALVVLGPRTRVQENIPPGAFGKLHDPPVPVFDLQCLPTLPPRARPTPGRSYSPDTARSGTEGRLPPDWPAAYGTAADGSPLQLPLASMAADSIQRLTAQLKGETIPVRTPHDLAEAIRRMDRRIPKSAAPSPGGSTSAVATPAPSAATTASGTPASPVAGATTPASPVAGATTPAPPVAGATTPVSPAPTAVATPTLSPTSAAPASKPAAETSLPAGDEDPVEVLIRLRDQVVEHGERIPNHICVESIRRDRFEPVAGRAPKACEALLARRKDGDFSQRLRLETTDRLRLDVAFASNGEIYSWAGASRFSEVDIDELVPEGAIGTGPFASMLLSIFARRGPRFTFDDEISTDGRRLFQYSFSVAREESHYRVRSAHKDWIITGYSGTLLVDPKTSELVRLLVATAELPAETSMCQTEATLEYGVVRLDGDDYLLPKAARQRFIGREGSEAENSMNFSACRQFQAESNVAFGEGARTSGGTDSGPAATSELPSALPVAIELTTAVRIADAAAGDRVTGRLARAIADARGEILAQEGALVEGRLMRVETGYVPRTEHTVVLRWETIRIGGAAVAVNLMPHRRVAESPAATGKKELRRRGVEIELPLPGESQYAVFHLMPEHPVLDSGALTEWLTARR